MVSLFTKGVQSIAQLLIRPTWEVTRAYAWAARKDPETTYCLTWGYILGIHTLVLVLLYLITYG